MDELPVMRDDGGERERFGRMTKGQRRVMLFMAGIQIVMIAVTYLLLVLQTVTSLAFGIGAAPTLLVFAVVYLHFTKWAVLLSENGIRPRWIVCMRVLNPILYSIACVLCVCTMV